MTINIRINEDYILESDPRCFILKRKVMRESRDGSGTTEDWVSTFYPDLKQLQAALAEKTIKNTQTTKVKELEMKLNLLNQRWTEILKSRELVEVFEDVKAGRKNLYPELKEKPKKEIKTEATEWKPKTGRPRGRPRKVK